ncbi:thiamine ABC transporter substrate-binding protein [bacterium]|nr:thiamine ABC transporter substrate-binding protein [bacterium]
MIKVLPFVLLFYSFFRFLGATSLVKSDSLNVYTYDAMMGQSGFGEVLKKVFEQKTGAKLKLVSFGSEGEALNQLVIEGEKTKADILLGIDSSLSSRARATKLFAPISKELFEGLDPVADLGSDRLFLPFDFGYLAFIYHKKRLSELEVSGQLSNLREFMISKAPTKRVVIADPRTSSLGFSFLRWTQESCSNQKLLQQCWELFAPKLTTIAPSWSGAYGLFLQGEADWVLSYTTSRAYHLEKENNDSYNILIFKEGHGLQVEGAAVIKSSKKRDLIQAFLKLLVSEEVQKQLPLTQWMYPARQHTPLPKSFKDLPNPKAISFSNELSEDDRKKLLVDWIKWVSHLK